LAEASLFSSVDASQHWELYRLSPAIQAHNLKVVSSNPTPATKSNKHIKRLEPYLISRAFGVPVYINATSTPEQKNCTGTHKPAATRRRVQSGATAVIHIS